LHARLLRPNDTQRVDEGVDRARLARMPAVISMLVLCQLMLTKQHMLAFLDYTLPS
jgi:hypothetical protein